MENQTLRYSGATWYKELQRRACLIIYEGKWGLTELSWQTQIFLPWKCIDKQLHTTLGNPPFLVCRPSVGRRELGNNGNFICVFERTIVNLATYRQFTNAAWDWIIKKKQTNKQKPKKKKKEIKIALSLGYPSYNNNNNNNSTLLITYYLLKSYLQSI